MKYWKAMGEWMMGSKNPDEVLAEADKRWDALVKQHPIVDQFDDLRKESNKSLYRMAFLEGYFVALGIAGLGED